MDCSENCDTCDCFKCEELADLKTIGRHLLWLMDKKYFKTQEEADKHHKDIQNWKHTFRGMVT